MPAPATASRHQQGTLVPRGHALGDVGNNLGNAADNVGRKDLEGVKYAQKIYPEFPPFGSGIIRIVNEQGSSRLPPRQVSRRFSITRGNQNPSSTIVPKQ